jgi:hypothetical protein
MPCSVSPGSPIHRFSAGKTYTPTRLVATGHRTPRAGVGLAQVGLFRFFLFFLFSFSFSISFFCTFLLFSVFGFVYIYSSDLKTL